MQRDKIYLKLNHLEIGDDYPVCLMGVINLSSESFYKGSVYNPDSVPITAGMMIRNNAAFLDIGGRSTAPHANHVTIDEENERVQSALTTLFQSCDTGDILISIDTQYRKVAESAFKIMKKYGKEDYFVLNDVSCLCTDPSLADLICELDKPIILMAAHNKPGDSLGIEQTIDDLKKGIELLEKKGLSTENKVIVDPAIGRWISEKSPSYDLELVAKLEDFRVLNMPVLVGISRKSFIGAVLNKKDPGMRFQGTLAATSIAVFNGAHIVRTHDINEETLDTIKLAQAIRNKSI